MERWLGEEQRRPGDVLPVASVAVICSYVLLYYTTVHWTEYDILLGGWFSNKSLLALFRREVMWEALSWEAVFSMRVSEERTDKFYDFWKP